ncbi:PIG-L family deacetylase [Streptomyces sp. MUM 178J]|uniref:PIG-L family deacetylase n=1 Tax=Streptomyces sp. MUM 178J TaxID=2791991 RepID=UPI001F03C954|nr:PIG-L family deacetylase [Streptomyces sp. MUM 178J]WRQ83484.1 PIG-L family deacetylase [Streptomyces sp. MUM 178J]
MPNGRTSTGHTSTGPRRRAFIAGAAAVAAAAAGCSVPRPRRTGPAADPAPGMPVAEARRAQLMQVLAHPDDDLYFMNPDTRQMLDAGVPLVCVYVTAGEHNGKNRIPGRDDVPADRAAYSSARHQGLRQAYAELLGLDRFTDWAKDVASLRGGHRAETNTLVSGPRRVELVFLNLSMHTLRRHMALPALWNDHSAGLSTFVAAGSPLRSADTYDYGGLIDVLVGLMARYRPTVIQTLDPDPDIQHSDENTRKRDSEQRGYSDHGDHTAAACFSWAAMVRWVAEETRDGGEVPAFVATAFRGYYNRHWPKNLPDSVLKEKASHLVPYGGSPDWECGNASGCGDYNVGGDRPLTNWKGWVRSTRHRHPGPRIRVAADPDRRLSAYGVLGLRAVRWRERDPGGGRWGAPRDLGGGPLAPALGSATLADGRQLLFGLRFAAVNGHSGPNRREIVLLEQRSPGGPFLAWRGLGNPEHGDDRGRRIGVPTAVTAPDGRVHLFVRNADKGVSTRVREADGSWSGWQALPDGGGVQDGMSAAVDGAGRIHLFAAGRESVRHWAQTAPGQALTLQTSRPLPAPVDVPAALPALDGGIQLYFRSERPRRPKSPDDGRGSASPRLTAVRVDGGEEPGVRFDGYGPVTAAPGHAGHPVLLGRALDGRLQLHTGGATITRAAGPVALDGAALHLGHAGPRVVGMGPDAHPWTWSPAADTAG